MTTYAEDVVKLALTQTGGAYVFGGKAPASEADPKADGRGLDCSGLVAWATARLGVPLLGGSWQQLHACKTAGLEIPVAKAEVTRGALLFLGPGGNEHVVISLGTGMTIEARGKAYGIGSWSVYRDRWSAAALIPHVTYMTPPAGPVSATRLIVDGDFGPLTIKALQAACGLTKAAIDGVFGPQSKRALQMHLGVEVDSDIGPITIRALQKKVRTPIDGAWGPATTRALQIALNNGTF